MPELLPSERLRPCLLDRLTDEAPHRRKEGRDPRVMTLSRYRQAVLRDLAWLLNTSNRDSIDDIGEFEEIETSVLNYGIPDLCGRQVSSLAPEEISQRISKAIHWCEPRIVASTLEVTPISNPDSMTGNALSFEITGELWAQPFNEVLFIKTDVDLETGEFTIEEES